MGYRQILGLYFDNEMDSRFWLEKFEDFQARNLQNILFLVTIPNKNIERTIKIVYNDIEIVHSPDSTFENITRFLATHPSRKMKVALKNLFLASDFQKYKINYDIFREIYGENTIILSILNKHQSVFEDFYAYPQYLKKLFYPFYTIHEFKKFLNKLITKEPLCTNINEVIDFCLPYINSFEK
jgi:transposase-like protein